MTGDEIPQKEALGHGVAHALRHDDHSYDSHSCVAVPRILQTNFAEVGPVGEKTACVVDVVDNVDEAQVPVKKQRSVDHSLFAVHKKKDLNDLDRLPPSLHEARGTVQQAFAAVFPYNEGEVAVDAHDEQKMDGMCCSNEDAALCRSHLDHSHLVRKGAARRNDLHHNKPVPLF